MFRERYVLVRWVFLRAVGLIAGIAFISFGAQANGLVGERGILPAAPWLESVKEAAGGDRFLDFPTVHWLGASDGAIELVWVIGALASLFVVVGIAQRYMLLVAWALYLSICTIGRSFLSFQWDVLVTELLLASVLFAPGSIRPGLAHERGPHPSALMLLRLLLFKLMFSSGVVKLSSGDEAWRSLTALEYHYETQPLPTWIGWYAHQLPAWFHHVSVASMFVIQLALPFSVFLPRPLRLAGTAGLVFLQILIALTGNYCFFNLTALALCVLSADDAFLLRSMPSKLRPRIVSILEPAGSLVRDRHPAIRLAALNARIALTAIIVLLTALQLARTINGRHLSDAGNDILAVAAPFRSVNGYGLFAVMTTRRDEIIIEGSDDGSTWKPYELPYKPGDLLRAPAFVAPHQPRLDWQMWFAALGPMRQSPWFRALVARLLEGSPPVLALLEHNPFPDRPPKMIRAELYRYRFTSFDERAQNGAWWKRERAGTFMPPASMRSE